jgi:PAS domain S-box-containing protein
VDLTVGLVGATQLLLLAAVVLSAWQMREPRGRWVWFVISASIGLFAVRRYVTLRRLTAGELVGFDNLTAEVAPFLAAILLVVGVLWLAGVLRSLRNTQRELERTNRALSTLSHANQVLVRAASEEQLVHEVSRAVSVTGAYRLTWLGLVENDGGEALRMAAWAGDGESSPGAEAPPWAGGGLVAESVRTAVRTRSPVVVQHIPTDPAHEPWRRGAETYGYASAAVLPMMAEDRVLGVLGVTAREPDAFGDEEIRLLRELADDTAFGIAALRARSQRSLAEATLSDLQLRLESVVSNAPIVLWALDQDGVFMLSEGRSLGALGLRPGEVVGRSVFEVYKDFPAVMADARRALAGETFTSTADIVGTVFDVHYGALRDADGTLRGTIGVATDVTDRVRALESVRQSEADYRALVEHAAYGIYRAGVDGTFLSVNPALVDMLGYGSAEELLTVPIRDIYQDPGARAAVLERHARLGRVEGVEVQWKRKDGGAVTVRLSGRPIRDGAGEITGFEMFAENVTEQRKLEAQLRQAQKMEALGQLTGGIAHDFNNLLTIIMASAELVRAQLPESAGEARTDLAALQAAAERGAGMISKLLGFSRRENLVAQPVDLARLVDDLGRALRRLLPENIAIETLTAQPVSTVHADPGAVEQILFNLATNARDAMPKGGTLTLQVAPDRLDAADNAAHPWVVPGEYVRVTIKDTGVGMDEMTRARIFEPFFTTKPTGVGTGLGMAMVYGLMKQHQGFVHVHSEPDQGTEIRLHFPVAGSVRVKAGRAKARQTSLPMGSETILLVEDEEGIRRTSVRALEGSGYTVLVACDGEEALDVFRVHEAEIDLIISDLMMPRLGGRQLYEALRQQGKQVRFLFTSGYSADELGAGGSWTPGRTLLRKPWTLAELLGRVRETLDEKSDA